MFTIDELKSRPPGQLQPRRCPHCEQPLSGMIRPVVIATRNCPGCGRQVVAEPDPTPDPPPFSLEQLDAAHAAYTRTTSQVAWVMCVAFLVMFAVMIVMVLYKDTIDEAVRPFADPQWLVLVMFSPLVVGGAIASIMLAREDRRVPAKCPSCSTRLHRAFAAVVRATGNCCGCGRRLLLDPLPGGPAAAALRSIAEFKASLKRLGRATLVAGILLWVSYLAVFAGVVVVGKRVDPLWQPMEEREGPVYTGLVVSGWITVIVLAASALLIGAMRLFLRWTRKRMEADPVLNCPHCRAALSPSPQIIAGRRCPSCRRRVLADPEPVSTLVEG